MFIPLLYILTSLLPFAFTIPPLALPHIDCGFLPAYPVDLSDCILVLADLNSRPTTSHRITYGRTQPPPGNVPQAISHGTCTFRIDSFPFTSRSATDTFRLSDWQDDFQRIEDECLGPGKGHVMGTVLIGRRERFFGYLGGHPVSRGRGRGNGTLREIGGEVEV